MKLKQKTGRSFAQVSLLVGFCALPLFNAPLSAAVESDIVGYSTITLDEGKWYILGNPFTPLDGSTTFKINSVYTGEGFQTGDMLYILSDDGTFLLRYWNNGAKKWSTHPVVCVEDETDYPLSTAVYLNKKSVGDIVFSGKVSPLEIPVGSEEGNQWSLTALAYPKEALLNDYEWSNFASGDLLYTSTSEGDFTLHYWNSNLQGWSTHPVAPVPDKNMLSIGQAVYLLKQSKGIGTISKSL